MKQAFLFNFDLSGSGEATFFIEFGGKSLAFNASNVCNPVADLLKSMLSIIQEPSHLWGEENSAVIEWYYGDYAFTFELSSPDGKKIKFRLSKKASIFENSEVSEDSLEGSMDLQEFIYVIIFEFDSFIKRTGLLNYMQLWQKDEFPLTYFLSLKKYLIQWKKWSISQEEADILESEFMMVLS